MEMLGSGQSMTPVTQFVTFKFSSLDSADIIIQLVDLN